LAFMLGLLPCNISLPLKLINWREIQLKTLQYSIKCD
jgi:hypothetical protein